MALSVWLLLALKQHEGRCHKNQYERILKNVVEILKEKSLGNEKKIYCHEGNGFAAIVARSEMQ